MNRLDPDFPALVEKVIVAYEPRGEERGYTNDTIVRGTIFAHVISYIVRASRGRIIEDIDIRKNTVAPKWARERAIEIGITLGLIKEGGLYRGKPTWVAT